MAKKQFHPKTKTILIVGGMILLGFIFAFFRSSQIENYQRDKDTFIYEEKFALAKEAQEKYGAWKNRRGSKYKLSENDDKHLFSPYENFSRIHGIRVYAKSDSCSDNLPIDIFESLNKENLWGSMREGGSIDKDTSNRIYVQEYSLNPHYIEQTVKILKSLACVDKVVVWRLDSYSFVKY